MTTLPEAAFESEMGAPESLKRVARFSNAQVTSYEYEWARGKLYLFGLPGIAMPGGLLNFLPEPGPWRDRASLP